MLATQLGSGRKQLFKSSAANTTSGATPGETKGGNCGSTAYATDCDHLSSGAFNTTTDNIPSLAACVAKCRTCGMCNYVSFSLQNEDCSWYEHCAMDSLGPPMFYESVAVAPARDVQSNLYTLGMEVEESGRKVVLLVSKTGDTTAAKLDLSFAGALCTVLEAVGDEPGFQPPRSRRVGADGVLPLGPYAVALVRLGL